ncbi:hypothetical protein [Streptomyces sp. NPDC053079]|uniref:hypothetical protein n=1 Tax=Streptomyces sp. NPDC053079 TaxID=3365697 RepID=UPI0037D1E035
MTFLWGGGGGAYDVWAGHLERWATGAPDTEAAALPALRAEDFPPDAWERLMRRIGDALQTRLQSWADALTAALSACGDEFSAGKALAQARSGLHAVRALAAHPGLPEEVRAGLTDVVDRQIRTLQHDQERDAREHHDPRRGEARLRTLRDNPLTAVVGEPPAAAAGGQGGVRTSGWDHDPTTPARRRVITNL